LLWTNIASHYTLGELLLSTAIRVLSINVAPHYNIVTDHYRFISVNVPCSRLLHLRARPCHVSSFLYLLLGQTIR